MKTVENFVLTFLLNALWQAPVMAAVAALACRVMRSGPARHRHAVCAAALVLALVLPAASVWPRAVSDQAAGIAVPVTLETSGGRTSAAYTAGTSIPVAPARDVTLPARAATAAMWMLCLFLAFRMARLAWAAAKTLRICRDAESRPLHEELAARCAGALGLHGVELRWSSAISGPVTAGRLVILPESMAGAPEDVLAT